MENQNLVGQDEEYASTLPYWGREFANKYLAKTVNLYFLSGNIRDYLPYEYADVNRFLFLPIKEWISNVLFGNNGIIIFYDSSQGISFAFENHRKEYESTMSRIFPETPIVDFFSRDPVTALNYLEKYFFYIYHEQKKITERIILILDYAESIVPAGNMFSLSESDRYCLTTLNRWANEPRFIKQDISILLLTENLSDINARLLSLPTMTKIEIPLPDEKTRIAYLQYLKEGGEEYLELELDRGVNIEALGKLSAGLNLAKLYQLAADAYQAKTPITLAYLAAKKKEIIEKDAGGLLEFVESAYNLDYVSGNEFAKKRLRLASKAIKDGHNEVVPMGYLVSGAIGTGKTFLVSAFANEIGIPMVKINRLVSSDEKSSFSQFEHILNILKALAPVAVMIDEADVLLGGSRTSKNATLQTSFFSQLSNCMGNTEYRGKIIWFLLTCRPDLLPIDLKRQGRAEEHLALFYPETDQDKVRLLQLLQQKLKLKITNTDLSRVVKKIKFEVSGADLESILIRARLKSNGENRTMITEDDLTSTIEDFLPPTYSYEIELQNLVASLECTSKELIPTKYQKLDRDKIINEIHNLKQILGEIS